MKNDSKKIMKYIALGAVVFGIGNFCLNALSSKYGLGVIATKSIDKDLVVFDREWRDKISKGDIIYFSLPIETPYYKKSSNFGKIVMCMSGEELKTKGFDYYCNKEYLGTAKTTDKDGKPVEQFVFNGKIPNGSFFVMGTHPRSYDSRYWGFVSERDIKGVALWSI